MSDYKMTLQRRDYATQYEYRRAIKFWRDCGRTVRRVPGGVEVTGSSFGKAENGERGQA